MNNDKKIRLIGIPILAMLICLFFNSFFFTQLGISFWLVLLSNFIFTLLAVETSRLVILQARKKYAGIVFTKKRLVATGILLVIVAPVVGITHLFIEKDLLYHDPAPKTVYDYLSVAGSTFFFILIIACAYEGAYFFYYWRKTTAEKEQLQKINLQTQLELLKEQVQPHFLFNSLNSLLSLVDEDQTKAKKFIKELSSVYRHLLRNNEKGLVTLEQELGFARSYLFLLQTRFETGLQVGINISAKAFGFYLPPLTLQLLIENAVKHNQVSIERPLRISIASDEHQLRVANNLQKKQRGGMSEKIGLANLSAKYKLLRLPEIQIQETEEEFIVQLPLIDAVAATDHSLLQLNRLQG